MTLVSRIICIFSWISSITKPFISFLATARYYGGYRGGYRGGYYGGYYGGYRGGYYGGYRGGYRGGYYGRRGWW